MGAPSACLHAALIFTLIGPVIERVASYSPLPQDTHVVESCSRTHSPISDRLQMPVIGAATLERPCLCALRKLMCHTLCPVRHSPKVGSCKQTQGIAQAR